MVKSNQAFGSKKFQVFNSGEDLALAAAKDFIQKANAAILKKGSFKIALSGGNTPKSLFDVLAKAKELNLGLVDWSKVHIFWGDERYVSHESVDSNYQMTLKHLLSHVPVLENNVHPVPTDCADPNEAAKQYADILRREFQNETPEFDLIYLGMGPDGHTASLFPGTDVVKNIAENKVSKSQLVAAVWVEKFNMYRISLLPNVINQAKHIVFLVAGGEKAVVLNNIMNGAYQPINYPVQLICALHGTEVWFVDKAAVSMLNNI